MAPLATSWWGVAAVVVLAVAALMPFLVVYPVLLRDDDSALLSGHGGRRFAANSVIVVPGAWRVPRTPEMRRLGLPGHLSRAFTQRLDRAVRVAAETGIPNIVFSGGNGDSVLARRWVVERFGEGPSPIDDDPASLDGPLAVDALLRVPPTASPSSVQPAAAAAAAGEPFRVRLWIENRSTTTATNAAETAALVRNTTADPCIACGGGGRSRDGELVSALVVVSSPYHQARCRLFFGGSFFGNGRRSDDAASDDDDNDDDYKLFFIASAADEFENLIPADPAWIEARTVFNEEPDPSEADESGCRRPQCIFVRHPRWPLGALIPKRCLDTFQSYLASWRAFTNVARVTAWSTAPGAWAREVGALVVNLFQGKYSLTDLVHLRS